MDFDIGSAVGGGLGAIGAIIGGHMQQKAQESANRTNLQIANANNALQREMFNQQLQYNSFQNQRKMLEEAGYSPYALFNTSPVTSPSAPQLNTPTMQPENGLGVGVGNAMGSLANVINMLSDASNKTAEANQKDIQNKALPFILELQQKGMLSANKATELQNILNEATMKENISYAGLRNTLLGAQFEFTSAETARVLIENALQVKYGATMKEHEIMKLQGEIYKSWYEGNLTKKQLEYLPVNIQVMLRQIKVEEQNAQSNSLNAKANFISSKSVAAKNYADAANTNEVVKILRATGMDKAANELRLQDMQIKNGEAQYNEIVATTKQLEELANYYKSQNQMKAYQMLLDYANLRYKMLVETMPDLPFAPTKIGAGSIERMNVPKPIVSPSGGLPSIPFN